MSFSSSLTEAINRLMEASNQSSSAKGLQIAAKQMLNTCGLPQTKAPGFDYVLTAPFYNAIEAMQKEENQLNRLAKQEFQIVFIDGVYSEECSSVPFKVEPIAKSKKFDAYLNKIGHELLSQGTNGFVALNYSLDSHGIFVRLEKGAVIDTPIKVFFIKKDGSYSNLSQRIYFHIPQDAKVQLQFFHQGKETIPTSLITHFQLEENASVELIEVIEDSAIGLHHQFVEQKAKSSFQYKYVNLSSSFYRIECHVKLKELQAEAKIYGLNLTKQKQQAHFFANVEHLAEETTSYQHIKNLSFDTSRTSFEGKIYVAPQAQQTKAYQLNQNLVLSEKAANFSKPNLQILADDVKASHGATFTRLPDEEVFYLQSRGISEKQAKIMLINSFAKEFLELIDDQILNKQLEVKIQRLLESVSC